MNYYNYMEYRNVLDKSKMDLYDANEAFTKGTIFKTLYKPYRNYLPKEPMSMTEKGKGMLEIQMYNAASHDLGLYLDVFPNDVNVLRLRNEYLEKYNRALKAYQDKYGAIECKESKKVPYSWSTTSWPWEGNK